MDAPHFSNRLAVDSELLHCCVTSSKAGPRSYSLLDPCAQHSAWLMWQMQRECLLNRDGGRKTGVNRPRMITHPGNTCGADLFLEMTNCNKNVKIVLRSFSENLKNKSVRNDLGKM